MRYNVPILRLSIEQKLRVLSSSCTGPNFFENNEARHGRYTTIIILECILVYTSS